MGVVAEWKKQLGSDWEKTYAASNTIYVARQNNILFSVLAQFFGPEAINSRLILLETISFTTTPGGMLEALTRIIGDRAVGALFFGNGDDDGLRADGRQRAQRHRRRGHEAWHDAFPAAPGAVRVEAMADPSITSGPGPAPQLAEPFRSIQIASLAKRWEHEDFATRVRQVGHGEWHCTQPVAFGLG